MTGVAILFLSPLFLHSNRLCKQDLKKKSKSTVRHPCFRLLAIRDIESKHWKSQRSYTNKRQLLLLLLLLASTCVCVCGERAGYFPYNNFGCNVLDNSKYFKECACCWLVKHYPHDCTIATFGVLSGFIELKKKTAIVKKKNRHEYKSCWNTTKIPSLQDVFSRKKRKPININ